MVVGVYAEGVTIFMLPIALRIALSQEEITCDVTNRQKITETKVV